MNSIKNFPYNNNGAVSEIPTLPTGTIIPYSTVSAPDGYLSCNGAAISRETYKELFAIIGTTYGKGDGSTTFNIPNLSNAIMPTSNSVTIKGNGNSIVFQHSTRKYSFNWDGKSSNTSYGLQLGTGNVNTSINNNSNGGIVINPGAVGLTTDSSVSGVVGTLTSTKMNFIIKY